MGIYDAAPIEPIANVLSHLGARHAFVVAGEDGLDELTLTGPSHVAEARGGTVKRYSITPEQFGLNRASKDELLGGDAAKNAALLRAVLEGKPGPQRDIVLLNAAAAIVVGEQAQDIGEGIQRAAAAVDSGAALGKLEQLVKVSHDS